MKTKTHISISVIFLLTSLISCSDDDIQKSNDQEIFFEVTYVNHAWVDQFKGFLIDKKGQIRTYDNPVKWNQADKSIGFESSQIQENISQTKLSSTSISAADLENYTSKISLISGSQFTKPVSGGADRGITSFYAYKYDPNKQVYTPVLLSQTGDLETYNTDKSAIDISTWLTGVLSKVY